MSALKGLATGIGSLPYKNAQEALDLIFKYCPNIPFWPQLPKRDIREGMVGQFGGKIYYGEEKEKLEEFYDRIINKDLRFFQIGRDCAEGLYAFKERLEQGPVLLKNIAFIKCQITGLFTFGASLTDREGISCLHNAEAMQAFLEGLKMKALWQIDFFKEFKKKIIMFIDEPYLAGFGSAYTPLNREDIVKGLIGLTAGIKTKDVLIGVHCCGNTDWSILTDVGSIDIINFDAFSFLDKFVLYADGLKKFISRGGIICWGIAPTQEFSGQETAKQLVSKINDGINILVKKGVDRGKLSENLLISPACGLGTLDVDKPEKIFSLLSETSRLAQKTF